MTALRELTGLVLAGGGSTRMGQDKALLLHAGERLVDRAVRLLAAACRDVIVASGDGVRLQVGAPQVADRIVGAGPLAGITGGLAATDAPAVAVVAVDAPFVDAGVLALCARRLGDAPACLPSVDGIVQPLHGVWATGSATAVERALLAGERSPRRLARSLGAVVLEEDVWGPVAHAGGRFAVSWNRPEDVPDLTDADDGARPPRT